MTFNCDTELSALRAALKSVADFPISHPREDQDAANMALMARAALATPSTAGARDVRPGLERAIEIVGNRGTTSAWGIAADLRAELARHPEQEPVKLGACPECETVLAGAADNPDRCPVCGEGDAWLNREPIGYDARSAFPGARPAASTPPSAPPVQGDAVADLLASALEELRAQVLGECPSLLNEDSGGDAELSMEIDDALTVYRATQASAKPAESAIVVDEALVKRAWTGFCGPNTFLHERAAAMNDPHASAVLNSVAASIRALAARTGEDEG